MASFEALFDLVCDEDTGEADVELVVDVFSHFGVPRQVRRFFLFFLFSRSREWSCLGWEAANFLLVFKAAGDCLCRL